MFTFNDTGLNTQGFNKKKKKKKGHMRIYKNPQTSQNNSALGYQSIMDNFQSCKFINE